MLPTRVCSKAGLSLLPSPPFTASFCLRAHFTWPQHGLTTAQLCEPAPVAHTSISEEHAAFWLVPHSIPDICMELGLLHSVVCWKAVGSGHQHQMGLFKTFMFYGKSSPECYNLHHDGHGPGAANRLHTYFRLKAVKQRRLKVSLYPSPSLESFHMVACSGACGVLLREHQVRVPGCQSACPEEETSPQILHVERTKNH